MTSSPVRCAVIVLIAVATLSSAPSGAQLPVQVEPKQLELTRPVRPWEFMDAVGQRAALFGKESGVIEGWVYPLKVFRSFELRFHTENEI